MTGRSLLHEMNRLTADQLEAPVYMIGHMEILSVVTVTQYTEDIDDPTSIFLEA